ncbi:dihydroneopterin aldolase [Herbiconiux sp. VKM Ac-2851]|uniref:dihydroneopterin aldolase n=1 Tax=Herbiconiux sp. VKM Ac-2851 TaxID=2739025 RepID=UPI00156333A7|nr:dihydroneopterin aldolase [Herbiconiux sp. VKM Ac-2851]NQX36016.1 dihydroneopterin aldolase [Herbiconiux sp. VKM Ac-2851]
MTTDRSTQPTIDELDVLTLTGLEVFAHHGAFDFERENGQLFVLDVQLWLDTAGAAGGDDLAQTVHYGELAEEIEAAVANDPVDLIETLAERVAGVVLAHPPVRQTRVVVHKPDAPITVPFADVSITITRRRAPVSPPVPPLAADARTAPVPAATPPVAATATPAASAAPTPAPSPTRTAPA